MAELENDELVALFRNSHLSVILKKQEPEGPALYTLVTDQVFLREPSVVWERIEDVDGGWSSFVDSDFVRSSPAGGDFAGQTAEDALRAMENMELNDIPDTSDPQECVNLLFLALARANDQPVARWLPNFRQRKKFWLGESETNIAANSTSRDKCNSNSNNRKKKRNEGRRRSRRRRSRRTVYLCRTCTNANYHLGVQPVSQSIFANVHVYIDVAESDYIPGNLTPWIAPRKRRLLDTYYTFMQTME